MVNSKRRGFSVISQSFLLQNDLAFLLSIYLFVVFFLDSGQLFNLAIGQLVRRNRIAVLVKFVLQILVFALRVQQCIISEDLHIGNNINSVS